MMLYTAVFLASLLGQVETQRLVVDEPERSRCYARVVLPNGMATEVPVVNGWLPNIDIRHCADQVELVLDYRGHVVYDPSRFGSPVRYRPNVPKSAEPPREELPRFPAIEEPVAPEPPPVLPEPEVKMYPLQRVVPVNPFLRKPSEVPDLP